MTVVDVFRQAGLELSEEELAGLAADALARVQPRFEAEAADPDVAALLASAGLDMSPPEPGELERFVISEVFHYVSVMAETSTVNEVARRLGVDPSRIRQRITARQLYAVRSPGGREWRLPNWQFDGDRLLPGVDKLARSLDPDLEVTSVSRFVTTPNEELLVGGEPVSPRRWLAAGRDPETVAVIASSLVGD